MRAAAALLLAACAASALANQADDALRGLDEARRGAALQIRIAPDGDGSTRILDCAVIARTAAPACFAGM